MNPTAGSGVNPKDPVMGARAFHREVGGETEKDMQVGSDELDTIAAVQVAAMVS